MSGPGLVELAARARRDLARMNYPSADWVPARQGPDGRRLIDVLVVGGGMCGQTLAFALARDGVRNIRVIDRAAYGREGPWGTYARMDTLRSPKHLTGPDLGFPALTFRAWYEAQHGAEGWERLYKIATADWLKYLLWVREMAIIAVENRVQATRLDPGPDWVRVAL
jgi:FAD-dependent urate hydroxylase